MTASGTKLTGLKNLGPKSCAWLEEIGIDSPEALKATGAVNAYKQLKIQGYPVTLIMVYAIEGALRDLHWNKLPLDLRESLKAEVTAFHDAFGNE